MIAPNCVGEAYTRSRLIPECRGGMVENDKTKMLPTNELRHNGAVAGPRVARILLKHERRGKSGIFEASRVTKTDKNTQEDNEKLKNANWIRVGAFDRACPERNGHAIPAARRWEFGSIARPRFPWAGVGSEVHPLVQNRAIWDAANASASRGLGSGAQEVGGANDYRMLGTTSGASERPCVFCNRGDLVAPLRREKGRLSN